MGYFTDDSMLRRVHRESAVALSGQRALLMQAAHPVAFVGFFAHTGSLDEPYERLARTAQVMDTIGFGTREDADRATRRVRAMHRRVRGVTEEPVGRFPAGTPFAADDPDLLLWILACLVDSALVVYAKYVRTMSTAEREGYWQDYRVIGRLFGLRDGDMPASIGEFDAYMRGMLHGGDLIVTPAARELAIQIVLQAAGPARRAAAARAGEPDHRRAAPARHPAPVRAALGPRARGRAARRRGVRQARRRPAAARPRPAHAAGAGRLIHP